MLVNGGVIFVDRIRLVFCPRGVFIVMFQHGGARVRALEVKLAAQIEERAAAKQARILFPCLFRVCEVFSCTTRHTFRL